MEFEMWTSKSSWSNWNRHSNFTTCPEPANQCSSHTSLVLMLQSCIVGSLQRGRPHMPFRWEIEVLSKGKSLQWGSPLNNREKISIVVPHKRKTFNSGTPSSLEFCTNFLNRDALTIERLLFTLLLISLCFLAYVVTNWLILFYTNVN
jgi:hypothetical protein